MSSKVQVSDEDVVGEPLEDPEPEPEQETVGMVVVSDEAVGEYIHSAVNKFPAANLVKGDVVKGDEIIKLAKVIVKVTGGNVEEVPTIDPVTLQDPAKLFGGVITPLGEDGVNMIGLKVVDPHFVLALTDSVVVPKSTTIGTGWLVK